MMNIEIKPKVVCEIDGQECVILKTFPLVYPMVDDSATAHIVMYDGEKRLIMSDGDNFNMISRQMVPDEPCDIFQLESLKKAYNFMIDDIDEAIAELK